SNPLQIGLGVSVSSTTRIHSQGSVHTTDKNTDVAINGDGFFMVSDDGGLPNYLTRSGDFKLAAYGNFVNNAGFVV
ncbi:flagellar hook-basal body complex protein, partial [Campylobacter jejuni]|nr:flagellar hook-basal body complex protein [Campylobacter jejuni]